MLNICLNELKDKWKEFITDDTGQQAQPGGASDADRPIIVFIY
jgi:hypothetical protein